ncbi:MAG UNVERIFIED_CONTAM: hypothetical protein LVR18_14870 [Planctomycetaceae bacterium]
MRDGEKQTQIWGRSLEGDQQVLPNMMAGVNRTEARVVLTPATVSGEAQQCSVQDLETLSRIASSVFRGSYLPATDATQKRGENL